MLSKISNLLGKDATDLLTHRCIFPKDGLHLPGPDFVERILLPSDRPTSVLRNMQLLFTHGNLAGTGYLSILPVDQGIEHSAGASFAPNPLYFDPENIVKLAIEGGCSAVASTLGVLGSVARKYAHRIPFIVKINHNDLLVYPAKYDQFLFAGVEQAFDMGAVAVGATVYYGSQESSRQIQEVSAAFARAHELARWDKHAAERVRPEIERMRRVTLRDGHRQVGNVGADLFAGVVIQGKDEIIKPVSRAIGRGELALVGKGGGELCRGGQQACSHQESREQVLKGFHRAHDLVFVKHGSGPSLNIIAEGGRKPMGEWRPPPRTEKGAGRGIQVKEGRSAFRNAFGKHGGV